MKRILVLGGYGGFGARLARRLAGRGHLVLVAGRSLEKAEDFCAGLAGVEPVAADRNGDIRAVIAAHRPDLVIDAAGPFQGSSHRVPLACVNDAVAYLDLADARNFVSGTAALDEAARSGGVPIISGASSVPALSGAVARHLAEGLDAVRAVEIAISTSSRATAGASVGAAILSYLGQPVRLWRGRRWTHGWGWQRIRRETFHVDGMCPLKNRWLALAEVPDLELLPAMLPGRPAVTFRAGTDLAVQTLGLWLLSWPVRWLGLRSPGWLAPWLLPLQRLTRSLGGERSAMSVTLRGVAGHRCLERRWTLVAERGDGPEIPTLAAALLADLILAGRIAPGARDASGLLRLGDFEPLFASLAIRCQTSEADLAPPLFQRVMGARFDQLPPAVRAMHRVCADAGASGEAEVERGRNLAARLIAGMMRFPPAGQHPLHVAFAERNGVETWTREFGRHHFSSRLSERAGRLVERFGPLRFQFELPSGAAGLEMRMVGWGVMGVPLPLALAPRSLAREWEENGRFRFDVPISLPLVGLVVRYSGWLVPNSECSGHCGFPSETPA